MAELQPLLNHLLNAFFILMDYTADFSMRHYAGFSQIGSHICGYIYMSDS